MADNNPTAVASAVHSGSLPVTSRNNALGTTQTTAKRMSGFTLAELLVSVGVLVVLVLTFRQLLKSAATITTLGHKQMDADSQARQLLDRMAIDFAQMVKRSDVDYYVKSSAAAPLRRCYNLETIRSHSTALSRVTIHRASFKAQSRSSPIE